MKDSHPPPHNVVRVRVGSPQCGTVARAVKRRLEGKGSKGTKTQNRNENR